jgi:hypothetical protein
MRPFILLLAICAALLPASVHGQERTGRIEGTIYDSDGMPMGGARITVSSPTQIGGKKSAESGGDGSFRFLGLIPGEFKVTVSKKGFITDVRKGIRVSSGKTVTLDILLDKSPDAPPPPPPPKPEPGKPSSQPTSQPVPDVAVAITPEGAKPQKPGEPGAETYVITARPVVDVTKASTGETITDEYMESVPLASRSFQGVSNMTSNVSGGIGGSSKSGTNAGNPSVSGGAYFNNTYTVDGMETTDPVTHTFGTNFNFDAMADINVMTGGKGPEYSDTPGGNINMVTKSGSNKFEVDSSLYYQDDALTIKEVDEEGSTFQNLEFNVNVGGPIIRDKLWYYTYLTLERRKSSIPPDPNAVLPDHPAREFLGLRWFGKLTLQATPRHKIVWWAQTAPASVTNYRQAITVEPDAEAHQDQYLALTTAAWEWLPSDRLFVKTQLGFQWIGLRVNPESGNEDVSEIQDVGTGVSQRNYSRLVGDDRYSFSLHSNATYFLDRLGSHEIKGGFRYRYMSNPSSESYTGNQQIQNQFGQPYALVRWFVDFDEASSCDPNNPKYDPQKCSQGRLETSVSGNKLILFLQDRWKLPRYKRLSIIPGFAFHYGNSINPEGFAVTSFKAPTGHLNVAWDIFGNGKTVLRGGYNQYVDVGFLSMARFIGKDLISYRCNWDESTRTYSQNCRVGGLTRTVGRPGGPDYDADGNIIEDSKFNPDALDVPRVHEVTIGAEREWLTGFSTGLDFQWRRFDHQWEDLETNVVWNEVGDDSVGFKNGQSEFIYDLETPEEAQRRYLSLSIFARRFVGNWQLMASYTWSRSEGTVSEGFATPYMDNARQNAFYNGFLPDDRRHVFKLTGWYRAFEDLTVGGSVWVGSGNPYDKLYFNSFYGSYGDRRAPRGYDPRDLSTTADDEELRMPTLLAFDLKISYKLRRVTRWVIGEPLNLELICDIFNLFNLRTATAYEERNLKPGATTQWGDILDKQDPFRVRFGLRYRY